MSQNRQHRKMKLGGALSSQDTPQKETSEADFAAPEETEEFESGVPEAEEFGDVESAADTLTEVAGSIVEIESATQLSSLFSQNDTVSAKLIKNVYGTYLEVPEGKTLTLDLNGHTLTNGVDSNVSTGSEVVSATANDEPKGTIINKGTLTITDNSIQSTNNSNCGSLGVVDNVTNGESALYNAPGGTATILKGKFSRSMEAGQGAYNSGGNSFYYIDNRGTMTIGTKDSFYKDIQVVSTGSFSSLVHNGWYDGSKNTSERLSKMIINAGYFDGGLNTIKNDDWGDLVINNGNFVNAAQVCVQNWNWAKINGGVFKSISSYAVHNRHADSNPFPSDVGYLEINGGSFTAEKADGISVWVICRESTKNSDIRINAGEFNSQYICNDSKYTAVSTSRGNYTVAKVAQVGNENFSDLATAIKKAANIGEKVILLSDITVNDTQIIDKNVTLDLNGKTITGNNVCPIEIDNNVKIIDSGSGGTITNNSTNNAEYSIVLYAGSLTLESGIIGSLSNESRGLKVTGNKNTSLIMTGGKILSKKYALEAIGAASGSISINISGGEVTGVDTGIVLRGNGIKSDEERAPYTINTIISGDAVVSGTGEANLLPTGIFLMGKGVNLSVNGGRITGTTYGIAGNGTFDSAKKEDFGGTVINITGGQITGNSMGIYQPQNGKMTVSGGTIESNVTGVEIRAGKLEISGGNIVGKGIPTTVTSNGNGTTTDGVGVAVAQHTTKFPIEVTVSDGTISGYSAFCESNPQKNETSAIDQVIVNILGGNFKAINGGSLSIYSQDKKQFISGGYFSHMPDKSYVAEGKKVVASENSDCPFTIGDKANEENKTEVETAVIEPTVDMNNLSDQAISGDNKEQLKGDLKASAKSLKAPGLKLNAEDEISNSEVTEAIDKAKKTAVFNNNDTDLKTYSTIFFEVTPLAYDATDKNFTLEIQPMTQLVVSKENIDPNNFAFDNADGKTANAVKIGNPEKVEKINVPKLTMSLDLPSSFVGDNVKTIFVEHIKDNDVYNYEAQVITEKGKKKAVFDNPHGFSKFTVRVNANEASIGATSYSTLQDAINAATNGQTVKLLNDVNINGTGISIDANKNITLNLDGKNITGNITNSGSLTIEDAKGNGKINGTITNSKNTTISGGIVSTVITNASGKTTVNGGKVDALTTNQNGTADISNGTVGSITSNGTVNIYGGNITGAVSKGTNNAGTINAYGGTFTGAGRNSITPAPGYHFVGNTIQSIPAPSLSSNNYLSGLKLSQGTLTPAFDRNTTAYTVEVENTTDSITVTPVKDSYWASLTVNGKTVASETASEAIALKEGANTITVRVTAENGSTKDYTITVTRKAAPGKEYIKLQKAAADYAAYENEGYTESSWTAFEKALKEAQEALKDTSLSEEKAAELLANLDKAAGELKKVGTPEIESVKVSGNKVTVKLTGATENAEGYDYVIGKKNCITTKKYVDIRKNCGTTATFSYVQKGTYYVYCHAWKKVNGKKVFSDWSELSSFKIKATTVSAPRITSVKVKGRTVTVTIKNAKGTIGVDAVLGKTTVKDQYGKRPSDYGKLVIRNKKTTTIIFKNVPKGTYYVGVHAFNRSGGTNRKVFSKWSNIKKAVVK